MALPTPPRLPMLAGRRHHGWAPHLCCPTSSCQGCMCMCGSGSMGSVRRAGGDDKTASGRSRHRLRHRRRRHPAGAHPAGLAARTTSARRPARPLLTRCWKVAELGRRWPSASAIVSRWGLARTCGAQMDTANERRHEKERQQALMMRAGLGKSRFGASETTLADVAVWAEAPGPPTPFPL